MVSGSYVCEWIIYFAFFVSIFFRLIEIIQNKAVASIIIKHRRNVVPYTVANGIDSNVGIDVHKQFGVLVGYAT